MFNPVNRKTLMVSLMSLIVAVPAFAQSANDSNESPMNQGPTNNGTVQGNGNSGDTGNDKATMDSQDHVNDTGTVTAPNTDGAMKSHKYVRKAKARKSNQSSPHNHEPIDRQHVYSPNDDNNVGAQ